MTEPLKQVVDENYSDLPYHNKETEAIQAERAKPISGAQYQSKPAEAPKAPEAPKPEAPKV